MNLWRTMLDGEFVEATGEVRMGEADEARLYRFRDSARAAVRLSGLATW